MSEELLQPSNFEVKVLPPNEFADLIPSPERLQELVYSIYSCDGIPRSVIPKIESPLSKIYQNSEKKTEYIVSMGDTERLFRTSNHYHLKIIEDELRNYKSLAGFLKVEWGRYRPGENLPLEAMVLTKNVPWPVDVVVGSIASLTINPLLPKQSRLEILNNMLAVSYTTASKEDFYNHIYTILAPHVAKFGIDSGGAITNVSDTSELNDDPYAKSIFETFPGYWTTGSTLYRIIPNIKT
jgi:hypothetical protein